jgi:uncharacterized lipoprotein YajG
MKSTPLINTYKNGLLLAALCILPSTGCAPGLGTQLNLNPDVLVTTDQELGDPADFTIESQESDRCGGIITIQSVIDARTSPPIATIEGRPVLSSEPVGQVAQNMLEGILKDQGFQVASTADVALSARVTNLHGSINSGFPTSMVAASAAVEVEVVDGNLDRLYGGAFKGQARRKEAFLSEADVSETISLAIAQAFEKAAKSRDFCSAVSSNGNS